MNLKNKFYFIIETGVILNMTYKSLLMSTDKLIETCNVNWQAVVESWSKDDVKNDSLSLKIVEL